jgi:hypothetical protein
LKEQNSPKRELTMNREYYNTKTNISNTFAYAKEKDSVAKDMRNKE